MLIKTDNYPESFEFKIRLEKLPAYKEGRICPVRTKFLHDYMKSIKFSHPYHNIEDFMVEIAEKTSYGEFWTIGS